MRAPRICGRLLSPDSSARPGRIVEEGDHRTLLEQGGLYARLCAHQSGGYLGGDEEAEELAAG